jgi:hypothetical protein
VTCATSEYLRFTAPSGQTCGEYLEPLISTAGGYLVDPRSSDCQFCTIDNTDTFLSLVSISFSHRWRDFGILLVYIVFNIFAAVAIYWLARMPKGKKFQGKDKKGDSALVKTESNVSGAEKREIHAGGEKGATGVNGGRSSPGDSSSFSDRTQGGKQEESGISGEVVDTDAHRQQEKRYEPIVTSKSDKDEEDGSSTPQRPAAERFVTAPEL